ncbi:hypothetical protein MMC07_010004 [Pseudocyphellaria aurata]|nr:hypothetical protein [Pseudocyphellaria aurata]
MAEMLLSVDLGAAGRPTLTYLIDKAICKLRADGKVLSLKLTATAQRPTRALAQIPEDAVLVTTTSERDSLKLNMLRTIRPPPLKYAWTFYHEKHSAGGPSRLTVLMDDIASVKTFWEVHNQFSLSALQPKDLIHFFKRGVTPTRDDARNVAGGQWTLRIPQARGGDVWKETLLLAIGEQFVDAIQPGDDLCGLSLAVPARAHGTDLLLSLWTRHAANHQSRAAILQTLLDGLSPTLGVSNKHCLPYRTHADFGASI